MSVANFDYLATPCLSFLDAYPHPAFTLHVDAEPKANGLQYKLDYTNAAFVLRLGYNTWDEFCHAFRCPPQIEVFKRWVLGEEPTFHWEIHGTGRTILLMDITKTQLDAGVWVCTTILRNSFTLHQLLETLSTNEPTVDYRFTPSAGTGPHHGGCSWSSTPAESIKTGAMMKTPLRDPPIPVSHLMETFDWSKTSLGPRENWPNSMKTALSIVMEAAFPACLCWGLDGIGIYNDGFAEMSGPKHPFTWGMPLSRVWAEVWDILGPRFANVMNGIPIFRHHELVFIDWLTEAGLPEEYYTTWSLTPVRQEDGTVGGFIVISTNTSHEAIANRRMDCFRELITTSVLAVTHQEYANAVIKALSGEKYTPDVAFAALYFCNTAASSKGCPDEVEVSLELAGKIGIPEGHVSTPTRISIQFDKSKEPSDFTDAPTCPGHPWPFIQVIQSQSVIHLPHLPDSITMDYERRTFGDRPREAVVIPIGSNTENTPLAILVLGINTRRLYDTVYEADINTLRLILEATLHSTLSKEAEIKRATCLAELDVAKTAFFSNASHELRTPLTLIGGALEDCITNASESAVKENLKMAQRNLHRLRRLVDSLMDFSKLVSNKLDGQFRPVQLGLFTSNLALLFHHSVKKAGLDYILDCDSNPNQPVCYIDPDFWEKIVFNLLGNALKFTFEGSIKVSLIYTAEHAILTVSDTGVGIPSSDVHKIFERFHRVQTVGRSFEGTGIGLSLTKELVSLHGGRIQVESNNNPSGTHGCVFTVAIPLGKGHLPKDSIYEADSDWICQQIYARGVVEEVASWDARSPSALTDEHFLSGSGSMDITDSGQLGPPVMYFKKTDIILLVDDNADMRMYMNSILSRYCTVVEARDGEEALRMALEIEPDIILSDVMMPVMDGFTLSRQLRDRKETSLIPIILITAKSGDDCQVEGLLSGADDYLVKPFKNVELISRVHLQLQLGKRRMEMEVKFNQRTFEMKQLCEMSPVAIVRVDKQGRITYVNPRWYEITGCPRNSDTNGWHENVHHEDLISVLAWWKRAYGSKDRTTIPITIDFRWKNGNWCQGQCVALGNGEGLGAFTDITEQRKLEEIQLSLARDREAEARRKAEEAEKRRQEAEERRRAQELLIDVTSHELRQPVSAILNCSSFVHLNLSALYEQLISSEGSIDVTPEFLRGIREDLDALDAIYQCGLTQERIANDVLTLSRIQLDLLNIHPADFDLVKEVERIVGLFRNEAQMKKINLHLHYDEIIGQLGVKNVSTDRSRFAQIITNLISNAIKFTDTSLDKRNIDISLSIRLEPPPSDSCRPPSHRPIFSESMVPPDAPIFIYISVVDTGPGLKPDDLTRLFQRFQQGSHSHNVFGGSGLGLYVSRQLCTLMGGRIEVASTPGQGATFRFFIKATTSSSLSSTAAYSLPSVGGVTESSPSRPIHVLLTEDNLINQTILNRQLLKAGCTTVLASNGRQAIETLCSSEKPFDVILMDIEMPVLDGVSAVREIRDMEAAGKLSRRHRIFALTGNARKAQVEKIREAGMDEVIIKPYRIDEILAKLPSLS